MKMEDVGRVLVVAVGKMGQGKALRSAARGLGRGPAGLRPCRPVPSR